MNLTDTATANPRPRWKQWLVERFDLTAHNRDELLDELQRANEKNILPGEAMGMMQGVMEFGALQVRDIMLPRAQIDFIYHEMSHRDILEVVLRTEHSRYPVVDEDRDDLVGILLAKDLLKYIGRWDEFDIDDIIRPALLVPESQRLNKLLSEFRNNRSHMAVVIDEYSGVEGLVTFEDVLEQIVGDIDDEHDDDEEDLALIKAQDDGRYIVEAFTPVEDFNAALGVNFSTKQSDTVAGLVLKAMGKIPRQGEEIVLDKLLFRVLRSDNRRILLLEVLPQREFLQNSQQKEATAV